MSKESVYNQTIINTSSIKYLHTLHWVNIKPQGSTNSQIGKIKGRSPCALQNELSRCKTLEGCMHSYEEKNDFRLPTYTSNI